jgi:dsDNA-binding SOS-regulon protein
MDLAIYQNEAKIINELHESITGKLKSSVNEAIHVGEVLSRVKSFIPHGEFLPWIEQNCKFSRQTADNYRRLYEYADKLPTVSNLQEAYQQIEHLEKEDKISEVVKQKQRINHYLQTSEKPEGWKRGTDDKEAEKIRQEREFQRERINELKTEQIKKKADREKEQERDNLVDEGFKAAREFISETINNHFKHTHLNLSGYADNMSQQEMFSAIERYINSFEDSSRQLEATHNLIKKLKMIASGLQVASVNGEVVNIGGRYA